jgi:hypothetical protein
MEKVAKNSRIILSTQFLSEPFTSIATESCLEAPQLMLI